MTLDDANYLLGIAEANYNYAFKNMSLDQKVTLVRTWAFGLQDVPADIVMLAFMQLTTTSKWLPTVAEIREQIRALYWQAKEKLDADDNLRRLCRELGKEPEKIEDEHGDALRRYIVASTKHISAEKGSGLRFDTIMTLRNGYMTAIGSGQMGFANDVVADPYALGDETEPHYP